MDRYEQGIKDLARALAYCIYNDSKLCDCGKIRAGELVKEMEIEVIHRKDSMLGHYKLDVVSAI